MKKIAIFGSTGSIGANALKVISAYPEKFRVTALSCDANYKLLSRQAKRFSPAMLGINDTSKAKDLKAALRSRKARVFCGEAGLIEMAKTSDADLALMAISGNASLLPLVSAIESGKDIALASKEPLVSAGGIVMEKARVNNVKIIPVDSEHSAIFQCLNGNRPRDLKKIYLTGTGGPLRKVGRSSFDRIPPARMLVHPKWKMGKKISIDSATLMNKALEIMEARWLFDLPLARIELLIHPEAVIHSMVEFSDGAILAQLGVADMRLPIQYAFSFPQRFACDNYNMDTAMLGRLSFHKPDIKKFPCLSLACRTWEKGGSYPAVLNAANEETVWAYIKGRVQFTEIPKTIEKVLAAHKGIEKPGLKDITEVDGWAREEVKRHIRHCERA